MAAISFSPPPPAASLHPSPRRSRQILLLPRPFSFRLFSSAKSNGSIDNGKKNKNSSSRKKPSSDGGELKEDDDDDDDDILHSALPLPSSSARSFVPVFVTLPVDAVDARTGRMARPKATAASFMALSAAGVEGVSVELWWGLVEREAPLVYDWAGYLELIGMARRFGLKVRAIMAFHQCGSGPDDRLWVPLPLWVLEEMDKEPDLAYSDRFGEKSKEYISLGCDSFPVLKGRSPIQAYSDFMRSFRDTFRGFLGVTVTEIQVGMGPAGDLRYPSCPSEKLMRPISAPALGEFQCYDKYMLASLRACAQKIGKEEWGNGGPLGASNLTSNPEESSFFRSNGSWNTAYGRFFLEWYSGMLLLHGERLCMVTEAIFLHTGVKILAKLAGIHWHYYTCSHPSELTAGYYNTLTRDGYLPIAHMFSKYGMTLCCTCFDVRDIEQHSDLKSSPEGYIRQLMHAARMYNLPLSGENSVARLDDISLNQVIKNSRLYSNNARQPSLSFNYVRMNKALFDPHNWTRFTRFVKRMSDARTFQAKLDARRSESCLFSTSSTEELRRAFAYRR